MKPNTPTSKKTTPTMAAAFCTFVRVPRAVVVRSDMIVGLLGEVVLRTIPSRGSWASQVVDIWLLAAPGQLLQHARLDSNSALLLTRLGTTRAPVIAGTAHCSSFSWVCTRATSGGVAALGSVPEDTGTLVS